MKLEKMGSDPSRVTATHLSRSLPAERDGSDPIFSNFIDRAYKEIRILRRVV